MPYQILEFGVTSQAYKWASRVVEEHSAFLFSHNENTPVIPSGLLADMPERGEIALQFQGLLLNHETGLTNGDPDTHIEITRLRKPD